MVGGEWRAKEGKAKFGLDYGIRGIMAQTRKRQAGEGQVVKRAIPRVDLGGHTYNSGSQVCVTAGFVARLLKKEGPVVSENSW